MSVSFNKNLTKNIIIDLNKKKFMVIVPAIVLVNDVELEPMETNSSYINGVKQDPFGNIKDKEKREQQRNRSNRLKPTVGTTPGVYKNGKHLKGSELTRQQSYLSLAVIIETFHNGFYIGLVNKEDAPRMAIILTDILERLENAFDPSNATATFTYIEEFYKTFLKNTTKTVSKQLNNTQTPLSQNVVGYDDSLMSDDLGKRVINNININDILVK